MEYSSLIAAKKIEQALNKKDNITHIVKRPKFYGSYCYSLSIFIKVQNWFSYEENKENLLEILGPNSYLLSQKKLLSFSCFTNDLRSIENIILYSSIKGLEILNVKIIHEEMLDKKIKIKNKKFFNPWYNKFFYRLKIKIDTFIEYSRFENLAKNVTLLNEENYFWPNRYHFLYLKNIEDVLVLKLTNSNDILEIKEFKDKD